MICCLAHRPVLQIHNDSLISCAGLDTGTWINFNRASTLYFILLVLIGRYLIQPYFAAVFLEAYLAAFFRLKITKQIQSLEAKVGKPKREDLSKKFEEFNMISVLNFYQIWMIKALETKRSDLSKPPLWISDRSPDAPLSVLHFSLANGWKEYDAILLGGSILLFNRDDESLQHVAMLRQAAIRVAKASELDSDGIHRLGLKSQYLIIKIEQSLTARSVLGGNRYHWWQVARSQHAALWDTALNGPCTGIINTKKVGKSKWLRLGKLALTAVNEEIQEILENCKWYICSDNAEGLEFLLSRILAESQYIPPPLVKNARRQQLIDLGLQANEETTVSQDDSLNFRAFLRKGISNPIFELAIAGLIIASVFAKALICYKPSSSLTNLIAGGEYFFQFGFASEALLRLIVNRGRAYFADPWCCFDWGLVISFYVSELMTLYSTSPPTGPTIVTRMQRLVKVCRVLSILRLGRLSGIANIVNFLFASASRSLGIFTTFLMVIIFSFTIVGTNVFGQVCTELDQTILDPIYSLKATRCLMVNSPLSTYASFSSVEIGILTLLRVFSGNDWISIMQSCSISESIREDGSLAAAIALLIQWNASNVDVIKTEIMQKVQATLPGCQSTDELEALRLAHLVDCSSVSDVPFQVPCVSNCGNWFAQIYFPLFFFVSSSIIFNLVMSSLYEGLKTSKLELRSARSGRRALMRRPIIKTLPCYKLTVLLETWITNSNRRVRYRNMRRRMGFVSLIRIRNRSAVLCLQAWHVAVLFRNVLRAMIARTNSNSISQKFQIWRRCCHVIGRVSNSGGAGTGMGELDAFNSYDDTEANEPTEIGRTVVSNKSSSEHDLKSAGNSDQKPPASTEETSNIVFQNSLHSSTITRLLRQKSPDYVVEASFAFSPSPSPPDNLESLTAGSTSEQKYAHVEQAAFVKMPPSRTSVHLHAPSNTSTQSVQELEVSNKNGYRMPESLYQSTAKRKKQSIKVAEVVAESGLNLSEKLHVMRRGLAMRPRNVPLLRHYGELLLAAGEIREAEAVFQRALEIDPRDAGTLRAYLALAEAGKDEQAAEVIKDLLLRAEAVANLDHPQLQPESRAEAEEIFAGRALPATSSSGRKSGQAAQAAGPVHLRSKSEPVASDLVLVARRRRHRPLAS